MFLKKHSSVLFLLLTILVVSCVQTKKVVYLQKDDLTGKVVYDSVLGNYVRKKVEYTLRPNDIISIRIGSVTPSEFNFIKEYEQQLSIIRRLNQFEQNDKNSAASSSRNNNTQTQSTFSTGMNQMMADQFLSGFEIDNSGRLNLPKIGPIALSGLTIPEAEASITDSLSGFFETPVVRIQLLSFHFSIFGEVQNEGRYTSYDPNIHIFDAIALAGNLTEFANRKRIKVVRQEDGYSRTYFLNLLDEEVLQSQYFYLKPNDQIIVPQLKAKTWKTYALPNATLLLSLAATALTITLLFTR